MGSTSKIRISVVDQFRSLAGWALSTRTQAKLWSAVMVALAVTWSTYWLGPRPSTRGDSTAISPVPVGNGVSGQPVAAGNEAETGLAASRIRFPDWQQLIKAPADDATRRSLVENFRGETVTWEGYFDEVNEISSERGGSESGRFILTMYESEAVRLSAALGRAPALCLLSEAARSEISSLKPGQRVIVRGTLAAPETLHGTLLGTRLYNCEILLR
jgi:hypothetical protein